MSFSSPGFLFAFLPIVFLVYWSLHRSIRNFWLLFASLVFYSIDGGYLSVVLTCSIIVNHLLVKVMTVFPDGSRRLSVLWFGIAVNLIPLLYFKYWMFGARVALDLGMVKTLNVSSVVLPAGISFFTFQGISYLIDAYRREIEPARTVIDFGMYHTLFPQLIAGPIVRYAEVENRIYHRPISLIDVEAGIVRFCLGLGKKSLLPTVSGWWPIRFSMCRKTNSRPPQPGSERCATHYRFFSIFQAIPTWLSVSGECLDFDFLRILTCPTDR